MKQRTDDRWDLTPRELALIVLFWTFLAALSAANRVLDPRGFGLRGISPVGPIALPFLEAWLWAAFTPVIFRLAHRFNGERSSWVVTIPILIGVGIAVALAVDSVLEFVRGELFPAGRRRAMSFALFRGAGRFRFLHQFLVYCGVLAAGFAREYFVRGQRRQRESERLETQAATLEAQLAEARLEALRMQINPHFLFNTLHAISALVERDPAGVRRMITRLSELLRHTLESRGRKEVPLAEELDVLRRYIEIMEVRFQDRLRVRMDIPPDTVGALVPNLVLQPIVENALEHGAARSAGAGEVDIAASREGDDLVITVRDNGPGLDETAGRKREGVGLANTRERLAQLYGEDAGITLESPAGGGARAVIRIPYHTAADLRTVERR